MGISEAQIDLYFGWQERVLKKAMQVHYEGLSMKARMRDGAGQDHRYGML